MNRMLKRIIFTLMAIASASSHALDLNEALAKAYESNSELNAAREELKATDEKIMEALSRWLPHVEISASKLSASLQDKTSRKNVSGVTKHFVVAQNLFRGGGDIAAIKTAKYAIAHGRSKLTYKEQEVLSKTVGSYMQALQYEEAYKSVLDRERQAKQYLMGVKLKFAAGQNTKADIARAEADLASAVAERASTYANYRTAQASFLAVIGYEAQNLSVPKDEVVLPQTLDEATAIAMNKNPHMGMAINNYEVSNSAVAQELAQLLPQLNLQYSLNDNTDARDFQTNDQIRTSAEHTSQISLNLKIPVFDGGGKNWSELRKSKRVAKQSRYTVEDVRKNTIASLTEVWEKFHASKAVLEARTEELKARKITADSVLAEEKAGLRDTFDVITTKNNYFRAQYELLEARTMYFRNLYTLKSQLGECTAQGLGLKVTPFDPTKNYNAIKWQLISGYTGD